jgi:hypothetical protein
MSEGLTGSARCNLFMVVVAGNEKARTLTRYAHLAVW